MDSFVQEANIVSFCLSIEENVHMYVCVYYCQYCIELDL